MDTASNNSASKRVKFLSYEFFLALRNRPRLQLFYHLYIFCYQVGCRTLRTFSHLGAVVSESFKFIFITLIYGSVKKFALWVYNLVRESFFAASSEEKQFLSDARAELAEAQRYRSTLKKRLASGPKASAGELSAMVGEQDTRIAGLKSAVRARRMKSVTAIAIPVAILVAVGIGALVSSFYDVALSVEYDGKNLGYIKNERVYDSAVEQLENKIIGVETRYNFAATPLYKIAYVSGEQVYDAESFSDILLSAVLGDEIETGCGIYVDDVFLLAVREEGLIREFMTSLLEPYQTGDADTVIDFYADVEYRAGMYPVAKIMDYDEAVGILGFVDTSTVSYTCVKADTVSSVAEKNGLTVENLLKYNPDIESKIVNKKKITITIPKPFLQIQKSVRSTYTEVIPYDTIIRNSSSYYEGYNEITTAGRTGSRKVTADIIYVDGVEVGRNILESTVTKEPRSAVKLVGTKTAPKTAPSISFHGVEVTGVFMWPVNGGYISCKWMGYSGHRGLDIAAPKGTDIYASDGGVVTKVNYSSKSYGYHVRIDHGNGFETLYAHCSKILVEVGDIVVKGEKIAEVGRTGRSTGNHLHFEVWVKGVRVNPITYITQK